LTAIPFCAATLLLGERPASGQFRLFDWDAGVDYLSELQKSLTISSSSGTVTVLDLGDGNTTTAPLDGDPRLLNRKFGIEWSLSGPGVRLPLSLSTPRVIGGAEIRPTATLEALHGDFDLRFLNQREEGPNDSLHGRGMMYGLELAVRADFPGSHWFGESGYRFHSLPNTDAHRSRPFTAPGPSPVLTDESRLSRETHDAFTRFGYSFYGKDVLAYAGVRYRSASVEIQDDLRYADTLLNQETSLSSRTQLESSETEAIGGVEARRGSFIGRTEITFNDKDYGVLASLVYTGKARSPTSPRPSTPPPVFLPTLKLFWDLAGLQVRDPSVVSRLLSTNPWQPAETLDSLGVGFASYQEELAKAAGVRPLVLFVSHETDLVEEARRRNLTVSPWPPMAPPAMLSGPGVDILILFQPLASRREFGTVGAVIRAQVASAAGLASRSLVESVPDDRSWAKFALYTVEPIEWSPSVQFKHTRCVSPSATHLRISLTYTGGVTVPMNAISIRGLRQPWKKCAVPAYEHLRSITVLSGSRRKAESHIIASSYYVSSVDASLGPLIAKFIRVK
jgi:hypothetical protein